MAPSDIRVPQAFVDDRPPVPPRKPSPEECCGVGCDPCIFDRYAEALTKYEAQFAEWQARREHASSGRPE